MGHNFREERDGKDKGWGRKYRGHSRERTNIENIQDDRQRQKAWIRYHRNTHRLHIDR